MSDKSKKGKNGWQIFKKGATIAGRASSGAKFGSIVGGLPGALAGGAMGIVGGELWDQAGEPETMQKTREHEERINKDEAKRKKEADAESQRLVEEHKKRKQAKQNTASSPKQSSKASEQRNAERGRPTIHIPD